MFILYVTYFVILLLASSTALYFVDVKAENEQQGSQVNSVTRSDDTHNSEIESKTENSASLQWKNLAQNVIALTTTDNAITVGFSNFIKKNKIGGVLKSSKLCDLGYDERNENTLQNVEKSSLQDGGSDGNKGDNANDSSEGNVELKSLTDNETKDAPQQDGENVWNIQSLDIEINLPEADQSTIGPITQLIESSASAIGESNATFDRRLRDLLDVADSEWNNDVLSLGDEKAEDIDDNQELRESLLESHEDIVMHDAPVAFKKSQSLQHISTKGDGYQYEYSMDDELSVLSSDTQNSEAKSEPLKTSSMSPMISNSINYPHPYRRSTSLKPSFYATALKGQTVGKAEGSGYLYRSGTMTKSKGYEPTVQRSANSKRVDILAINESNQLDDDYVSNYAGQKGLVHENVSLGIMTDRSPGKGNDLNSQMNKISTEYDPPSCDFTILEDNSNETLDSSLWGGDRLPSIAPLVRKTVSFNNLSINENFEVKSSSLVEEHLQSSIDVNKLASELEDFETDTNAFQRVNQFANNTGASHEQGKSISSSVWSILRQQVFLGMSNIPVCMHFTFNSFVGMMASSVPVRGGVPNLVDDLTSAGVRFVFFSPRNMRRSKKLAEKIGLQTDWNCAISLRALDAPGTLDPHRFISNYADWDVKARLPHGVEAIRTHLREVDNVPLLVSLFTDATPSTVEEMVGIFQEYGEVVMSIGSSYRFVY